MICLVLFVFSILVSATTSGGETETVAYKPTDVFLISCGATSNSSDTNGRTWTPEQREVFTSNVVNASFSSKASKLEWSVPPVPYKTVRIFRSKFTYSISVSPGWKFLRLHFYSTRYGSDTVKFFFSVTVNGFTLLKKFNPDLTAKASSKPFFIKEFIIPVLGGHKMLNLTLTPSPHMFAFINGVEIVSMPNQFYTKGGFDDYITDVGSNSDFEIDDTTVLETVYRVNVAGDLVPQVTDTGMFRQWASDSEFIQKKEFVGTGMYSLFSKKFNYTKKTPTYVSPEAVYSTYRSISNDKYPIKIPDFSLTWLFPVDAGFNYLVRLHFCDTQPEGIIRMFSIVIGNQIAKAEINVRNLSGGPLTPMYLDFKTFLEGKSGKRPNLRLDLRPPNNGSLHFFECPLSGIEILKLNDTKGNLAGCYKSPIALHVLVIILIAIGSAIGLATFIVVFIRQTKMKNRKDNCVVMFKVLLKQYTYAELKKITKSFSHTLGKGGFGTVYGGNLSNGVKVAVKVMKDLKGTGEDFMNEVSSMSQTSHVNIVSLLGFCYEGSKRAIVYEFLENGSLDQFISSANSSTLNVTTLYGIALGIARGLEYLHYGCKTRIVHFDIKPQNILLDGNLCPKVSDFGLAKLCEKRESIVSLIETRGTVGYIAPEVVSRTYGGVSHKSDVYSFGMLVLDMVGANNKEIVATAASNASSAYFPDWVYKELENGEQTWRFGDEITREEKETARKMILVGLWCIKPCPSYRPPMNKVVEMMEGSLDALEIPPKPSMHISTRLITESSSLYDSYSNS